METNFMDLVFIILNPSLFVSSFWEKNFGMGFPIRAVEVFPGDAGLRLVFGKFWNSNVEFLNLQFHSPGKWPQKLFIHYVTLAIDKCCHDGSGVCAQNG